MAGDEEAEGMDNGVELNNENDDDNNEGEDEGAGDGEEDAGNNSSTDLAVQEGGVQPLQAEGHAPQEGAMARIGGWPMVKTLLLRMFIIYCISSVFRRGGQTPAVAPDGSVGPAAPSSVVPAANLFPKNTLMDMYIYITEKETFNDFNNHNALFWNAEELDYGDWTGGINGDGIFSRSGQIPISEKVQMNGSLYIHVFIVKTGHSPNPADTDRYNRMNTIYKSKQLTKLKKRKFHIMKNLITGTSEIQADLLRSHNESSFETISHWHPNLTINLIDDHTPWVRGSVPAPLDEYVEFLAGNAFYYPVVYFNDYWNLNQEYMPINSTTPLLNFTLTYQPLSLFKWQMYAAQGMRSKWYSFLGDDIVESSDDDQDSLKQAFLDTSPYLLGITVVVSIVHSIFEFLAFKNDIQFWRNRKSLEGLSVRSVFFNVFQSVVVLLYVMDNETNFVIKVSIFIGLGIEIWKIQKVIDIKIDRENKIFGLVPWIRFQDKSTYTESQTKKYDQLAFKYLSWLLFPLLAGYAIYSILYLEHKGWYSWVLGMMYGFLLTFGFIMMTPQLFINYKLKSVAHLPWRMLTYKALNTFIDDLFAFVIKMPMLYRLGCFRDDIIFLIYVYQRWIYRVDPKRMNEFGTSGEMMDEHANGGVPPPAAIEGAATETNALLSPTTTVGGSSSPKADVTTSKTNGPKQTSAAAAASETLPSAKKGKSKASKKRD